MIRIVVLCWAMLMGASLAVAEQSDSDLTKKLSNPVVLRLYGPEPEALEGKWTSPVLQKVN